MAKKPMNVWEFLSDNGEELAMGVILLLIWIC